MGECELLATSGARGVDEGLEVAGGVLEVLQLVVGFTPPEDGGGLQRAVVLTVLQGGVEVLDRLRVVAVREVLDTHAVGDALARLVDLDVLLLDLLDGCVGLRIVLRREVEVGHVVVDPIPIAGIREGLQEALEGSDGFVERGVRLLVDGQRIVVERLLLHVRVEVHAAGRFEAEPGIGDILLFDVAGSEVEVGVLSHRILDCGHCLQAGDRILVVARLVIGVTQHIHVLADHLLRLFLVEREVLDRVDIVLLCVITFTQEPMDLFAVRVVRVSFQ